jgi:multiple antibiotic resistance protein
MLASDMRQFIGELLLVFAGLLPIVNPVGSAPMFLAMTRGAEPPVRAMLARVVAINSTLLLIGAFAIGAYVLKIFGLSVDIVQVAGGAVLCRLGWTLLNASPDPEPTAPSGNPEQTFVARAFYPLTMPLTVDPGVLSVAIALGANHSRGLTRTFILESSALIAIVLVGIAVYVAYRYSGWAARRLGHSRTQVILRLSAFIVLCIGLQIAWTGIKSLHTELYQPPAPVSPTTPLQPGSPFPVPAPSAPPPSTAPAQPG